jgi:beta-glucuronidase
VRGVHYPQDQRLLDAADALGLLVWEEITGWGLTSSTLSVRRSAALQPTRPRSRVRAPPPPSPLPSAAPSRAVPPQDRGWLAAQHAALDRMISRSFNHASVAVFGLPNEAATSSAASEPAFASLAGAMRARRTGRLLSWATNKPKADRNLKLGDLVSVNRYPGWYDGPVEGIGRFWKEQAAWARAHHPSRPFLIAETGASGRSGWRNGSRALRWSEEMQEEIVRRDVDAALALDDVAGVCVWQLFDVRVDAKHWPAAKRPGGLNNKGVLSQWREPKLAAQSVQRLFRGSAGDAVSSRGYT